MIKEQIHNYILPILLTIALYLSFAGLGVLSIFILDLIFGFNKIQFDIAKFVYLLVAIIIINKLTHFKSKDIIINKVKLNQKRFFTIFILSILLRICIDPVFRFSDIVHGFSHSTIQDYPNPEVDFYLLFVFLNVVVLTPIIEELIFRQYALGQLLRVKDNIVYAIIISSLMFSTIHLKIDQFIVSFIFSILSFLVYIKYGIIWSVCFHFIHNTIWLILDTFRNSYWEFIEYLNFGILYWLIWITCAMFLFFITNKIWFDSDPSYP